MNKNSRIKIGIQGGLGSFHEIASMYYFGLASECIPFHSFDKLIDNTENNNIDVGIVAIENTVAGSLLPNYALLKRKNIKIIGEVILRIEQNLMCLPNQIIEDINEVHSHPIALQQCRQFLKQFPKIKLIETDDTANSARKIKENNLLNIAAIASKRSANLFDLNIIVRAIETNKRNFTRFLIISNSEELKKENLNQIHINKASLSFSLPHERGSLSSILSIFAFYSINLTKIQSNPILGKEWEYHFIVDLTFDKIEVFEQSLEAIKPLISEVHIYGIYKKAEKTFHSNNLEDTHSKLESLQTII